MRDPSEATFARADAWEPLQSSIELCTPTVFDAPVLTGPLAGGRAKPCSELVDLVLQTRWAYGITYGLEPAPRDDARGERTFSLGEYLEYTRSHPGTRRVCLEQPVPDWLGSRTHIVPDCAPFSDEPPDLWLFVGAAGNYAPMHFDSDHRHVLLHQVFGRKLLIVAPPGSPEVFVPFTNMGMIRWHTWSLDRRRARFARARAASTILEPGQSALIPALWWHGVQYIDTSLSVSIRFGRNRAGRTFHEQVFPDIHNQLVGSALLGTGPLRARESRWFDGFVARLDGLPEKGLERHETVSAWLRDGLRRLVPSVDLAHLTAALARHPELRELERRSATSFYADATR